jgi:hypothetical protein
MYFDSDRESLIYKGKKATIKYQVSYGITLEDGRSDYQTILEALHPDITWFHGSGGSYQGEWWSAGYDKNGKWFTKQGSFGSCSGCDLLQGIGSQSEAEEFFKDLEVLDPAGKCACQAIKYLKQSKENAWSDAQQAINEVIGKIIDSL